MIRVQVTDRQGNQTEVEARPGFSLMETLRNLPDSVEAICGGMCACATCHVYVDPAWVDRLPPRSYEELVMLRESPYFDAAASRLSCQLHPLPAWDGLAVRIAPEE